MMLFEAYNLYKSGFKWAIYTPEDLQYLAENTEGNNELLPVEDFFFEHFRLTEGNGYYIKNILNFGKIIDYISARTTYKLTKYEVKAVLTKHKINYGTHRDGNLVSKGIVVYTKDPILFNSSSNDQRANNPFL